MAKMVTAMTDGLKVESKKVARARERALGTTRSDTRAARIARALVG
jgi:hypothetical protein